MEQITITEFHAKNILGLPKNALGVPEVHLAIGTSVEISGLNGSGKSSILNALRATLVGGSLEDIKNVHVDATPEATVVFDDGRIRLERSGNRLALLERVKDEKRDDAYKKLDSPQTRLNAWFDKDGSNPLNFIRAGQKERLDLFMRALPVTLTAAEVAEAMGVAVMAYASVAKVVADGGHPLMLLASLRETITAERRGLNVAERQKRDTVQQLLQKLPPEDQVGTQEDVAAIELERDERSGRLATARADAETAHHRAVSAAVNGRKAFEADRRQKLEVAIAALRAAADADIREEMEREQAARQEADAARTATLAALASDQQALDAVTTRLGEARVLLEQAAKDRNTREMAEKFRAEADNIEGQAASLSAGLVAIERLKARLLADLPIAGLTVTDKDIFVNDVAFDQLNTAARIDLATQVTVLRSVKFPLKVAFIDGAEALDDVNRAHLMKRLEEAGIQAVVTRVTPDELRVG